MMMRTCVRCATPSNATLTYAYDRREAWLFDVDGDARDGTTYPMCDAHADRVTTPIGWVLHDRRSPLRAAIVEVA
jgi:hypothetical protein